MARLYYDASQHETIYALLVIKDGHLIAEDYFNGGFTDKEYFVQSATKSYTSALVGVALEEGAIESIDQPMLDYFPEVADSISDPRKREITIRQMLQMRGGYPDEEYVSPYLHELFFAGKWSWTPHIKDFPLVADPGTEFNYSNLSSHLLGIIVSRATGEDLRDYGQERLFGPIGAQVGEWRQDGDGYRWGCIEISFTARDLARFGRLYLDGGQWNGEQIVSADYVAESLEPATTDIKRGDWLISKEGRYHRDIGYGYQWWSARVGTHRFSYAAGHGGSHIVLLHDLDMVIVTAADPLYDKPGGAGWEYEVGIFNMIGRFIKSLPGE